MTGPMQRHTFVVYVEDKPGVLNRVASLFRRRAFNIESLTVGHAETPKASRMTIVVRTDPSGARRLEANLYKLVNVLRVHDITSVPAIFRELAMIKVGATADTRTHVMQLVDVFRARVVDVAPDSVVIETTGTEEKIDGSAGGAAPLRHHRAGPDGARRHDARRAQRDDRSRGPAGVPVAGPGRRRGRGRRPERLVLGVDSPGFAGPAFRPGHRFPPTPHWPRTTRPAVTDHPPGHCED